MTTVMLRFVTIVIPYLCLIIGLKNSKSNSTVVTSGAGTTYPSGALEDTSALVGFVLLQL